MKPQRAVGATATAPLIVTGVQDGRPVVTPADVEDGRARELYLEGEKPGKHMQRVNRGAGDWVQVTTYRYVGPGAGQFNVDKPPGEDGRGDGDGCACWQICCCLLCIVLCFVGIIWVAWPDDGAAWFGDTTTVLQHSAASIAAGAADIVHHSSAQALSGLDITIGLEGVNLRKVAGHPELWKALQTAVHGAVSFYVKRKMSAWRITVYRHPDTDMLHADVLPPCGADVDAMRREMNLTSLGRAIVANLLTVDGLQASQKEPVTCTVFNIEPFRSPCEGEDAKKSLESRLKFKKDHEARAAQPQAMAPPTAPPATLSAHQRCSELEVSGADGPSAGVVNGRYILEVDRRMNGRELYRKDGIDLDVWIAFVKGRWYVTDTQHKDSGGGGGWLYSEVFGDDTPPAAQITRWEEWDGEAWTKKPAVKVQCVATHAARWAFKASNLGCRNWRAIEMVANTIESHADACGERCAATAGCTGFNFLDKSGCGPGADGVREADGLCSLFSAPCEREQSRCWMEFSMLK